MALTAPTVTGYSAFWSTTGDHVAYAMALAQARSKQAKHISKFMKRMGTRDAYAALAALIGAAAGGTATNTWKREQHPAATNTSVPGVTSIGDFGGNINIETVTAISRATTAADVTELKKWFNNALLESGITYPTATGSTVASSTQFNGVVRF